MLKSDDLGRAHLLVEMARMAEQHEQTAKALGLYDDALAHFSEDSTDPMLPDILRWKGTLLRERGETDGAFRCYTRSLEKAVRIGSERCQAHALNCLGTVAQRRCDHKETERLYAEASALAKKAGDARLLGMIEQNRGVLASMRGEFAQAAAFYSNSLGAFEMAADAEPTSWVLNNLGILHTKIRNYSDARDYLERGLAIAILGDGDRRRQEPVLNQLFADLIDRLGAEVAHRQQIFFVHLQQLPDLGNIGTAQTVGRTGREIELLDRRIVDIRRNAVRGRSRGAVDQLERLIRTAEAGDRLRILPEHLRRVAQRVAGLDRAVGPDLED
jgi:hypothetical protein